nr:hypothetical protein [uncultured bacterium]
MRNRAGPRLTGWRQWNFDAMGSGSVQLASTISRPQLFLQVVKERAASCGVSVEENRDLLAREFDGGGL